ncbi:MAG: Gfo/Idh/MocA family oxidoreductase [Patescibacteria group bacterium]
MMRRVKIIGAGSIGNHLAQAARCMGWSVAIVDADPKALERTKNEIYPKRYGAWDESIELYEAGREPKGGYDVICIGTPPDVRMKLALDALGERPKVIQLEKPLCGPYPTGRVSLDAFIHAYSCQHDTKAVVGYDHAVARSVSHVTNILDRGLIGEVQTIDVEFREHWRGIFSAHPWLHGPEDTYLGYTARGGGASGEHSHALHLWQLFARHSGFGDPKRICGVFKWEKASERVPCASYDSIATFTIETDRNMIGRVVQDVITYPTRKWARIQGSEGSVEWMCNGASQGGDLVVLRLKNDPLIETPFLKTRQDDFYEEMLHIQEILDGSVLAEDSPISFESGVLVMKMLATVGMYGDTAMRSITF